MLPTCPACKQSVLDDDAENCPFCGANMKTGKGGGAVPAPKTAPRPAAKASPAAASVPAASAKAPSTKAPTKSHTADHDDPFGVDEAANSRAIPLSPRPAKGKTVRLICPMCETAGFAGADVAGKEVKCCNEKCALPIFTAPKGDGASGNTDPRTPSTPMKTVAAPRAKKASPAMIVMTIMSLLLAGGSVWYFVFNEPGGIRPPPAPPSPSPANSGENVAAVTDPATPKPDEPKPAEKVRPRGEELRRTILPYMVDLSRETSKNRSKHVCRRLVAEAYVEAGDLAAARENIDQLLNLKPKLPYHQVTPLTQIAWREFAAGHNAAANAAMEQAFKLAPELPPVSRLTFEATTDLAALLFVQGRAANAQSLMMSDSVLPSGSNGTLSALSRRAHMLQSFDIDEAAASLPVIPWTSPQWVVTTLTLVLRGHADKGVEWLKRAPDVSTRSDCWAVWGDAVVAANASGAATKDELIVAAVKDETPTTQARVWARVAAARVAAKAPQAAQQAAAHAATALQAVPLPKNFVLLEMKELIKLQLPDATEPRLNAIAAAEVARTQTWLGQKEAAAKTLAAALQHLRGHAPSPVAAGNLFEATSRDVNAVRAQLRKDLNLKTDDKVQQALTTYRDKCRTAFDAGAARFKLQTEILQAAVDWPLVEAVWTEATAHSAEGTLDEEREDFLKTNLSVRLGQRLRAAGNVDLARQCENAVTTEELTDVRDTLERETAEIAEKGENVAQIALRLAAVQFEPAEGGQAISDDTEWPLLWALRLSCRIAKSGKTDTAFDLVSGFTTDMLAREEGYEMLAALTAKDPVAAERLWKKYRPSLITPTERIAIFRGLCAGLSASLSAKP